MQPTPSGHKHVSSVAIASQIRAFAMLLLNILGS